MRKALYLLFLYAIFYSVVPLSGGMFRGGMIGEAADALAAALAALVLFRLLVCIKSKAIVVPENFTHMFMLFGSIAALRYTLIPWLETGLYSVSAPLALPFAWLELWFGIPALTYIVYFAAVIVLIVCEAPKLWAAIPVHRKA